MNFIDFLSQLLVSLPAPIFGLVVGVVVVLCYFALYLLFVFLEQVPALGFLFLDLDKMVSGLFKSKPHFPKPRAKVSRSYRTDPTNRALQNDLLILLKGDVPTAKRLLLQQRRHNPGQSDNWYLEKVIYDLERDRH